jgi:hypothetical protein
MKISAHQPAYLPWGGYIERISLSDVFIILDDVQFEKNSFTNRNQIKTSNGPAWLTVPVNLKGHISSSIKDIEIVNNQPWHKKHWKTIQQNYQKSPFFRDHEDFLEDTYSKNWTLLNELNSHLLSYFLHFLDIDTKIVYLSSLNVIGKKQDLIVNLCEHFSASDFIFGALGKDYVQEEKFLNSNIKIHFHEYQDLLYKQLWGDYIPNLSILDMLMNVEPSKLKDFYR